MNEKIEHKHYVEKKELYVCDKCGAIFTEDKKIVGLTFDGFLKMFKILKEEVKVNE